MRFVIMHFWQNCYAMSGPRQHYFRKAGLKNKPRRKSSAILNISLVWENYTNCDKTYASERFVYVQMIAIYAHFYRVTFSNLKCKWKFTPKQPDKNTSVRGIENVF